MARAITRDDPFAVPERGFEPWSGPWNTDTEFAQADLTPTTLKAWLSSDACAAAMRRQRNTPNQTIVSFVDTPQGKELHVERAGTVRIYSGPLDELKKIARAAS